MPDNVNNLSKVSLALILWNTFKFVDEVRAGTQEKIALQNQTFTGSWYNFHIDQTTGRLVKRQFEMLGMVQKILYRTTLK